MSAGAAGGAAAAAAAAAAARRRALAAEEERMSGYGPGDLEGWEFKILRSGTTRAFRTQESLRRILDEEARAGWELVEKFDDLRVRVKRRVECRELDRTLPFDPYRTWVGTHPNRVALMALLGIGGFIATLVTIAALAS